MNSPFFDLDPALDPLNLLGEEFRDDFHGPPQGPEIERRLREIVARDGDVACDRFCREIGCSPSVIRTHFGTWTHLRRLVGLPVVKPRGPTYADVTADDLRAAFRRLFAEEGEALTCRGFLERTGYTRHLVCSRVGGWRRLRREHGLGRRARASDASLLRALTPLIRRLRRFPTCNEVRRHTPYSATLYIQRFGSWRATERAHRRMTDREPDAPGERPA